MTNHLLILIALLVSTLMSRIIIPQIILTAFRKRLFDEPDERKIHAETVPRLAGFSFVPILLFSLSLTAAVAYAFNHELFLSFKPVVMQFCLLVCGLILLYLIGLRDDLIGARYRVKFIVQILTASFIPLSGIWINDLHGLFGIYALSAWIGVPLTVFITVFIINAINLIDGIDGLASGLSSISLVTVGVFFMLGGSWPYAILAFIMLGTLVPFFYYNVFGRSEKNKKIFMGDAGSLTLGYVLAFLVIGLTVGGTGGSTGGLREYFIAAFSTLIVPAFDVCRVILVRIRSGKHLFMPDRNHIHHKFLKMGFSARRAMICILGISFLFCVLNLCLAAVLNINILALINVGVWIMMHLAFNRILDRQAKSSNTVEMKFKNTGS